METKNALIIMLKNAVAGKVKTRLAADIGDNRALNIYRELVNHTHAITQYLNADKFIFYSDVVERNDQFNNLTYKKYVQCSGHLGVRMDYAFSIPFKNEYKDVVMIGSDCYDLTQSHIEQAFEALNNNNDFVIGPANDGGYYLIGMKKWNRWVLENKNWSTNTLLQETKDDIIGRNGKLFLTETLSDIDTISDLQVHPKLLSV